MAEFVELAEPRSWISLNWTVDPVDAPAREGVGGRFRGAGGAGVVDLVDLARRSRGRPRRAGAELDAIVGDGEDVVELHRAAADRRQPDTLGPAAGRGVVDDVVADLG